MRKDPKVRKDKMCAQCRKPRKHAVWSKYAGDQAVTDPFCSSACARAFHGTSLPVNAAKSGQARCYAEELADADLASR